MSNHPSRAEMLYNGASPEDRQSVVYYRAHITVSRHTIGLETDCLPAFEYLKGLDSFFGLRPYEFAETTTLEFDTKLRYLSSSGYTCDFDDAQDILNVSFPWDHSSKNLMHTMLWHLFEYKRQCTGEYVFHASAVVRDGSAIVLTGPSESGKTTIALELCRKYGFSFYANDVVLMALNAAAPHLLFGDLEIRMRLSSLREYDPDLARKIFGNAVNATHPWDFKRDVAPEDIELKSTSGCVPISQFAFVRLDRGVDQLYARCIDSSDSAGQRYFHSEITSNIRGGSYSPVYSTQGTVPFFIPSLDRPALLRARIEFMESVAEKCALNRLRGRLDAVTKFIHELHRQRV